MMLIQYDTNYCWLMFIIIVSLWIILIFKNNYNKDKNKFIGNINYNSKLRLCDNQIVNSDGKLSSLSPKEFNDYSFSMNNNFKENNRLVQMGLMNMKYETPLDDMLDYTNKAKGLFVIP